MDQVEIEKLNLESEMAPGKSDGLDVQFGRKIAVGRFSSGKTEPKSDGLGCPFGRASPIRTGRLHRPTGYGPRRNFPCGEVSPSRIGGLVNSDGQPYSDGRATPSGWFWPAA